MQDSERGAAADWERTGSEDSDDCATRRSRRGEGADRSREFVAWEARGGCRIALRSVAQAVVGVAQPCAPRQALGAVIGGVGGGDRRSRGRAGLRYSWKHQKSVGSK